MISNIADIRRDYKKAMIDPSTLLEDPIEQFKIWLHEALASEVNEATAMVLSTVNANRPSSRVVLLKDVNINGFVFYTNYNSDKGNQIQSNPNVCLNFFWPELERQVRIEGTASKVTDEASDKYFNSRPKESRIGAWASPQSQVVENKEFIEQRVKKFSEELKDEIKRPPHWGGYTINPSHVEFWQGGAGRLHDRVLYQMQNGKWNKVRLAP